MSGFSIFGGGGGTPGPGSVTNAMLANMPARTVKANATNSAASPQDVVGTTPLHVFRVNATGTGLEWGAVTATSINLTASPRLLGRTTAGAGASEELSVDGSMILSSLVLSRAALTGDVTAAAGSNATTIANNAVTNAKFRQGAGLSVVGVTGNATANVADIVAGSDEQVLRRSGAALAFGTLTSGAFADNTIALSRLVNASSQYNIIGRTSAGTGAWEQKATSADVWALLGSANNATFRTNLGLGTAATYNVGTSGTTVPLNDGTNTWGGVQTFTLPPVLSAVNTTDGGRLFYVKGTDPGVTLAANVATDLSYNSFRIFENGGTFRGAYINIASCAAAVATPIYYGGYTGQITLPGIYSLTNTSTPNVHIDASGVMRRSTAGVARTDLANTFVTGQIISDPVSPYLYFTDSGAGLTNSISLDGNTLYLGGGVSNTNVFIRPDGFNVRCTMNSSSFNYFTNSLSVPVFSATLFGVNVNTGTIGLPAGMGSTAFQLGGPANTRMLMDAAGSQFVQHSYRTSSGDFTTPTGLLSGRTIAQINWQGHDGTAYTSANAAITVVTTENWAVNSHGTEMWFSTNNNGQQFQTVKMTIRENGYVDIPGVYNETTASAANVFVDTDGSLRRSTSALKYKTSVEDIEPERVRIFFETIRSGGAAIWYRSKLAADSPKWGYYGIAADAFAANFPQLVHWKTTREEETVEKTSEVVGKDDNGNDIVEYTENRTILHTPIPQEEWEPEGFAYERTVPFLALGILDVERKLEEKVSKADENEMSLPLAISDGERKAIRAAMRKIGVYQWKHEIDASGASVAKLHVGVTAQSVKQAFVDNGLDPDRYAIFHDEPVMELRPVGKQPNPDRKWWTPWRPEMVDTGKVEYVPTVDENGKPVVRMGLRYEQLFALAFSVLFEDD